VGATICNYCRAMALFAAAATHGNADMCSRLFWIILAWTAQHGIHSAAIV